ncbi:MAG: hypothetical protein ACR2ND_03555 [Solirubrobacteraceae bacterium]
MFDCLDFVYFPSRDVAGDLKHFTDEMGADVVFAIEAYGTAVAMIRLSADPPAVLLAGHLQGDQPVHVYRVSDLDQAIVELERRGAATGARFEIPPGPIVEILSPGPQRLAVYQLTRPETSERMAGRRDF